jgi:hypothetical protein
MTRRARRPQRTLNVVPPARVSSNTLSLAVVAEPRASPGCRSVLPVKALQDFFRIPPRKAY